jgi:hypothetical protein
VQSTTELIREIVPVCGQSDRCPEVFGARTMNIWRNIRCLARPWSRLAGSAPLPAWRCLINNVFHEEVLMFRRFLSWATIALACLLATGCAVNRATATSDPTIKWDAIKSVHVKKLDADERGVQQLLANKLKARGFSVTVDPQPNPHADALVTYVDKWMWDITMYMLELTVQIRDPQTNFALASGNSFHTSLTRKSPTEMVDEVVDNILKTKK